MINTPDRKSASPIVLGKLNEFCFSYDSPDNDSNRLNYNFALMIKVFMIITHILHTTDCSPRMDNRAFDCNFPEYIRIDCIHKHNFQFQLP